MPAARVVLEGCSKRYGERLALRRVSVDAAPGETIALLGPNGAGKSTLIRLVAGLARPTAGVVTVDGVAPVDAPPALRRRIGYVAHRGLLYRDLTARENLRLMARLERVAPDRAEALLERVGLGGRGDERVDGFSRGMAQRLAIARALLADPDLLLLDEPATGLDAEAAAVLDGLLAEGHGSRTVLYATHDTAAAARVADRAVTLREGRVEAA